MKFRILSDLHLEFADFKVPALPFDHNTVLVLAGDINVGLRARQWIERLCDRFKAVVYVAGNHEFYHNDIVEVSSRWVGATMPSNFHFLFNQSVIIDDEVEIHGTPLWSNFENESWFSIDACRRGVSDFEVTKFEGKVYSPAIHLFLFNQALDYLTKALAQNTHLKQVVVTHFVPSTCLITDRYVGDPLNGFYCSNLDRLIPDADLWVHGHQHSSHDRMLGDTRVVCNPRGYIPYEPNPEFNPFLTVEV